MVAKRAGRAPLAPADRPIPRKQLKLLEAYQAGDNGRPITGKEAAIRAGYPPSSAVDHATWVMSRPNCKAWLKVREKAAEEKHGITLDRIVSELAKVGFANMADYIEDDGNGKPRFKDLASIRRDHMAAVTELTLDTREEYEGRGEDRRKVADVERIKFKLASKIEGLVNLGKLLGYFPKNEAGSGDDPDAPGRVVRIVVTGGLPKRKVKG